MISSSHFTTDNVNITVSVEVKNIGDYDGAEVTQAYISFPPIAEEPPKVLRGFEKNFIEKGKHRTIIFSFGVTELSYWSTTSSKWTVPRGKFEVLIGSSSRNIHATLPFYVD
jgi:beta-glucosidase